MEGSEKLRKELKKMAEAMNIPPDFKAQKIERVSKDESEQLLTESFNARTKDLRPKPEIKKEQQEPKNTRYWWKDND